MGVLQSANNPVSFTLLSDTFPRKMRSRVNSVQNSGVFLGGALSSFSVILIKWYGWRQTYNMIAVFGFLIGATILVAIKDPPRVQKPAAVEGIKKK